jgi:lipoprotein-releasing system permease protein
LESGGGFLVTDWTQENPNFFRSLELTKKIIFIVLLLILSVACFNIVSTLIMLIREKRSNIAVLRSLGVSNKSIYKVFLTLGFILGFLGSILGSVLGFVITVNLSNLVLSIENVFDITLYQPEVYFLSEIPVDIIWSEILIICFIAVILSMFSAFIPSYNATKINPSELLKLNR